MRPGRSTPRRRSRSPAPARFLGRACTGALEQRWYEVRGVDGTGPMRMTGNPYTDTKCAASTSRSWRRRGLPVTIVRRKPPVSPRAFEYATHPGTYSIEEARRVLGWTPRTSLEEGMAGTRDWLEEVGLVPLRPA